MIVYALDTNIVSYFLKNNEVIQNRISTEKNRGNSFVILPTVYFEIRNWLLKNNSKKKAIIFEKMYSEKGIEVIDQRVLDVASDAKEEHL